MSKPNNEMIIHLTSGDKLRLHRVAEPQTEAGTVSASILLQSFTARNAALEVVEAKVCF